jgi:hypothetical protein
MRTIVFKWSNSILSAIQVLTQWNPADLNSAIVRKLKLHFKSDQSPQSIQPDYTCGYENLPDELLKELLQHLEEAQI